MLDIILKILPVLGTILLILILLLLAALLLVLFFPVTYRLRGRKEGMDASPDAAWQFSAKLDWLFGLLRVRYFFPEPGILKVKLLCFKLYEAKLPPDGEGEEGHSKEEGQSKEKKHSKDKKYSKGKKQPKEEKHSKKETHPVKEAASAEKDGSGGESEPGAKGTISCEHMGVPESERCQGAKVLGTEESRREEPQPEKPAGEGKAGAEESEGEGKAGAEESEGEDKDRAEDAKGEGKASTEEPGGGILEKFQKIKYTICGIYDKIKEIWKNISYYSALLQEENTKQLYGYACQRLAKILKNIRPRRIRADILFGTGSPDTTGYVFGLYCMFYPALGAGCVVTPDFERAVLEGRLEISGHITLFVLGMNLVRLMLDKRLRLFISKLKNKENH